MPSWNRFSSERLRRTCVYDLCLRRVPSRRELARALAAAFPPDAKAGRSLLHAKPAPIHPSGEQRQKRRVAACLSVRTRSRASPQPLPKADSPGAPGYPGAMEREGCSRCTPGSERHPMAFQRRVRESRRRLQSKKWGWWTATWILGGKKGRVGAERGPGVRESGMGEVLRCCRANASALGSIRFSGELVFCHGFAAIWNLELRNSTFCPFLFLFFFQD